MKRNKLYKYSSTFYRRRRRQLALAELEQNAGENVSSSEDAEMEIREDIPQQEVINSSDSHGDNDNDYDDNDGVSDVSSDINVDSEPDMPEDNPDVVVGNYPTAQQIGLRLKEFLPGWACRNEIPHTPALSTLLAGLTECGIPGLPKDPRTLLGTPQNVVVRNMGPGEFWYQGVSKCLQYVPKYLTNCASFTVKLDFGIDGLPLHRSSQKQFWPILLKIANIPEYPCQVVAIYYGKTKPPSVEEYLEDFCQELLELIQNGLEVDGIQLAVTVNALICDMPACCFIACVAQFNAYHGCLKCTVVGEYHRNEKRMSYPQIDCPLRTDNDFRTKSDPNHHQKNADGECIASPLERLPIDMVRDIVIADSLHLVDFGVMKTLLKLWIKGSRNLNVKFFNNQILEISNWLTINDTHRPSEIHRALKELDITNWKATQFHTFMFY